MVKMLSHRVIDNLSCMLLAKDELQAASLQGMEAQRLQKMEDSEFAKENAQLRRQLLEVAADNDAISKSLQERAQSLADVMDANFKAESKAKVLQVQLKSMQKDMDAHKYELHLLRKQLQIRNDEKEQNKKATDASHKKHLDNVKKVARLESECQRLRGLIRQRLPGPAAIAQMRAECEVHIKMGKKRSISIPSSSRNLPSSSYLQYQREIEALTERLLSVEDEAKFLKEAMARRTAELQEARLLCARTAMKLSSTQNLVEAMSIGSVPSTPQLRRSLPLPNIDHYHELIDQENSSTCVKDEGMHAACSVMMHAEDHMDGIGDLNSEIESSCNNGEADELSCAESWASALIAELSHLSNLHDNASVTSESLSVSNQKHIKTIEYSKPDAIFANLPELEFHTALQNVTQKLSYLGESIFLSQLIRSNDDNQVNFDENNVRICSASFCARTENVVVLDVDQPVNILEEIAQTKHLLVELGRAMEMKGRVSLQELESDDITGKGDRGCVNVNDDLSMNDEEEEGKNALKLERILSRLDNMEDGDYMTKISAAGSKNSDNSESIITTKTDQMEETDDEMIKISDAAGRKYSESCKTRTTTTDEIVGKGDQMIKIPGAGSTNFSGDMINTSTDSVLYIEDVDDKMIIGSAAGTKFSGNTSTTTSTNSSLQLNLAGEISDVASELEQPPMQDEVTTHVQAQLDAYVALERLLQAELELSRGKIATLEDELSCVLQKNKELSDTCSLTMSLEADLACALANVEELKLQVFSLKSELADQHSTSPARLNGSTLSESSTCTSMKEEQDLAAARAQLADCQRSIHVMRKQMASDVFHFAASQDVIIDELASFDSSSESSKSTDQKSLASSPIMKELPNFDKPSSKSIDMKPMELHNGIPLLQQEDNPSNHDMSSNSTTLQENNISHQDVSSYSTSLQENNTSNHTISSYNTQAIEEVQSFEKCKAYSIDDKSTSFSLLIRSTSKDHTIKPAQFLAKPPTLSTTSRIVKFFNRAKSTTKERHV